MRKKLAVPHHLYVAPLTYGLVPDASPFELLYDLPAVNGIKLRQDDVDAALITPIDYARESSDYSILPGVAVSSKEESQAIALFFRSGLLSISTIAVDIGLTSEIVLTRIIMAEKYNINPQFIPMMPDLNAMLVKADAALLAGNSIFGVMKETQRLDLVDEWADLTDLPYIHGFWGYKPNALNSDERRRLIHVRDNGIRHLDSITQNASDTGVADNYLHRFSYILDDDTVDLLGIFFRYSFYYGIITDVPEVRIDTIENESEPDSSPPS